MLRFATILLGCYVLMPILCDAQRSVEFTAGVGATGVDLDRLVEKDEVSGTTVEDWDVFSAGFSLQGFIVEKGNVLFGGEIMYQHWYWYQVRVPFGSQPITREYSVDATRFTAIARLGAGSLKLDVGPQINFTDGVSVGLLISGNYYIDIGDRIAIPVKLRVDLIDHIVITVPVSIHTGVKIRI